MVAVDLVDGFYLFRWSQLSSLFALPGTVLARDVGVTHALDDNEELVEVTPDTPLFAALSTLPMGWCRALYFCHSVLARAMVVACHRAFGISMEDSQRQLVVDGRSAARVAL